MSRRLVLPGLCLAVLLSACANPRGDAGPAPDSAPSTQPSPTTAAPKPAAEPDTSQAADITPPGPPGPSSSTTVVSTGGTNPKKPAFLPVFSEYTTDTSALPAPVDKLLEGERLETGKRTQRTAGNVRVRIFNWFEPHPGPLPEGYTGFLGTMTTGRLRGLVALGLRLDALPGPLEERSLKVLATPPVAVEGLQVHSVTRFEIEDLERFDPGAVLLLGTYRVKNYFLHVASFHGRVDGRVISLNATWAQGDRNDPKTRAQLFAVSVLDPLIRSLEPV